MSIDLTTHYGGLVLRSPIAIGACPLTAQQPMRMAIERAGAGAIVLPTLFEEQVLRWNQRRGRMLTLRELRVLERASRMQIESDIKDAESYLALVHQASSEMTIPVLANLCGENPSIWFDFAMELQEAGASAIELNLHHPPPREFSCPRDIEDQIVESVKSIRDCIGIPLYVQLSREYTSLSHLAVRLLHGAQGLVLFGRTPKLDILLDSFELTHKWTLTPISSVSNSLESIMRVHSFCPVMPLAACGGIHRSSDVIKVLLAGADVAMVASAVYREGPDVIRTMLDGLIVFMERHRMRSIAELHPSRPLYFSNEEDRLDYVQALSRRYDPDNEWKGQRAMQGDRWGHPYTP
ncbi:Dihydroorotate dehydrogenase B (NAD(+)), catalytic subunit [Novipirellula aureliae]|uniref:Dihydroorotate dehydrogenase B (NAD(+)), catalytic subunit n=1 Tax=Novipirellula aureliae TaxID=2527966 RepID=A0A5C6DUX8_9BACT|nr:dihydroorotate dehydrogenase [Novipirellula aureliae]TWU41173.1 Dihydroorotate dehydrogenase B (NAD(+)), catalytic subunit [Novipirellula aureliae]